MSERFSTSEILHYAQGAFPNVSVVDIDQLAPAGSDRMYYRIKNGVGYSIIATQSANQIENKLFIKLANYFADHGLSVPQILAIHESKELYLQGDAGGECLLDKVIEQGHTEEIFDLYKQSVAELPLFQWAAKDQKFESTFNKLDTFGYDQILYDLRYFKNNFLKQTDLAFDDTELEKEFDVLAKSLDNEKGFFMYRDCQGRNIMVHKNKPVFIDFQGGLQGHPLYDVASLLWQAKAKIPTDWKQRLLEEYFENFLRQAEKYDVKINVQQWKQDYHMLTLTRLLQVLGAYGLRGLQEGKEHFISSIPLGLANIAEWLGENNLSAHPVLHKVLQEISTDKHIKSYT